MAGTTKPSRRFLLRVTANDQEFVLPSLDISRMTKVKVIKGLFQSETDGASLLTVSLGPVFDQTWVVGGTGGTKLVFFALPLPESTGGARVGYSAPETLTHPDPVFSSYQSVQTMRVHMEEDGVAVGNPHLSAAPLFLELLFC